MIIYKATNIINGKCYIGQTKKPLKQRIHEHHYRGYLITNSLHKYGSDNFSWETLCQCETKEELDEMEFHYIKQYHSHVSEWGYNLTWGGDGTHGWKHTSETLAKFSGPNNPNYGKPLSEKTKQKLRENRLGKKETEETKKKLSSIRQGKDNPCYNSRGDKSPLSKTYTIVHPDGHVESVTGLREFCRKHDLSGGSMNRVANGHRRQYKGYYIL